MSQYLISFKILDKNHDSVWFKILDRNHAFNLNVCHWYILKIKSKHIKIRNEPVKRSHTIDFAFLERVNQSIYFPFCDVKSKKSS